MLLCNYSTRISFTMQSLPVNIIIEISMYMNEPLLIKECFGNDIYMYITKKLISKQLNKIYPAYHFAIRDVVLVQHEPPYRWRFSTYILCGLQNNQIDQFQSDIAAYGMSHIPSNYYGTAPYDIPIPPQCISDTRSSNVHIGLKHFEQSHFNWHRDKLLKIMKKNNAIIYS